MLKDLRAVLYYLIVDYRFSFMVFFSIMSASLIVLAGISLVAEGTTIYVFLSVITLWFSFICGFNMTRETFPFLIKMGITRNQYILGGALFTGVFSLAISIMVFIIQHIMNAFIDVANLTNIANYTAFDYLPIQETILNELWLVALVNFLVISLGFVLGSVFYRFGMIGGVSTIIGVFFLFMLPESRSIIVDFLSSMKGQDFEIRYTSILILSLVLFLPNWTLLRRASTISARLR
ncbi:MULTISPECIES: hypothetical protein [Pontibacillus]|uniref:ABC-2 family transporter n=1 Tax=Pontibacillus chungwhensis TaxID=265426 RepID=A0ABY8V1Z1_9BACI|nr:MULTISPECIES: hypothetical protein [Pontibacillus]MCD5322345.1 hypothetical protein [Pontibacillus sp. HN14]WIF99635.1 hypothetical protein QNI29_08250 [Pontibacillus chungwhensis]